MMLRATGYVRMVRRINNAPFLVRVTLTRALRARRARPPEVPEAAARAACVSTWLGESERVKTQKLASVKSHAPMEKVKFKILSFLYLYL